MQKLETLKIEKSDFLTENEVTSADGKQRISVQNQQDNSWSLLYQVEAGVGWATLRALQVDAAGLPLLFHFDTSPIKMTPETEENVGVIEPHLQYSYPEAKRVHFSSTVINKNGQKEQEVFETTGSRAKEDYPENINFSDEVIMFIAAVRQFTETQGQDTDAMKAYLQLSFWVFA